MTKDEINPGKINARKSAEKKHPEVKYPLRGYKQK